MTHSPRHNSPVYRLMHSRSFDLTVTHFAPLLCLGLGFMSLAQAWWDLEAMYHTSQLQVYLILVVCGIVLGGSAYLIHKKLSPRDHQGALILAVVGFVCGVLPVLMILSATVLMAVTLFTVLAVVLRVASFLRTVASLLAPNRNPTWPQVGSLLYTYLSLLTAFTLINVALDLFPELFTGTQPAFNFGGQGSMLVNSFYFSVVVMTTLGFGDITPHTSLAKVSVALQCLTSYVMFALLVGVATRGVLGKDDK